MLVFDVIGNNVNGETTRDAEVSSQTQWWR